MKNILAKISLLALLSWVPPGAAAGAENPKVINFGIAAVGVGGRPFVGGSALSVVQARQLLEEEFKRDGIEVRWHFFKNAGPGVNEAYSNDALDFAWQGDLAQLIGRASGLKIKYLLSSYRRGYFYLAAAKDSTANAIADIKGRKVALHKGTCTQLSIARLLADNGLKEKDLKAFNMDGLSSASALANGELELTFGAINLYALRDAGLAKIIYSGAQDDGKYGCAAGVTVTEAFAGRHPEITQRVVNTLLKGTQWASDEANRQALYDIWEKGGIPRQHYEEEWRAQDLRRKLSPLLDEYIVNSYRHSFEDAKKFGLVRGSIDFGQFFDRSYLDKGLEALQLQEYWKPESADGKPKS
jgi:sulfonate transport system substrate-binding protein